MNSKMRYVWSMFALLMAFALALGAVVAARAAETKTFRIENKTRRDVWVEIYTEDAWNVDEGNKNANYMTQDEDEHTSFENGLRIVVVPAFESVDIGLEKDKTYWYQYRVCGKGVDDIIDAKIVMKKDITLTIYPCEAQPTTMQIKNHLGETVKLTLVGYEEKTIDVPPGLSIVDVYSGETIYKYDACGTDFNGVIDIDPAGRTQFYMRSCEWHADPAREFGANNVVEFRLINHASFPIILSLVGPTNYLLTVNPGVNRVRMVTGVYEYSYFIDYQQVTGSFFVSPNGNGIAMFYPAYTITNGLVTNDQQE